MKKKTDIDKFKELLKSCGVEYKEVVNEFYCELFLNGNEYLKSIFSFELVGKFSHHIINSC